MLNQLSAAMKNTVLALKSKGYEYALTVNKNVIVKKPINLTEDSVIAVRDDGNWKYLKRKIK